MLNKVKKILATSLTVVSSFSGLVSFASESQSGLETVPATSVDSKVSSQPLVSPTNITVINQERPAVAFSKFALSCSGIAALCLCTYKVYTIGNSVNNGVKSVFGEARGLVANARSLVGNIDKGVNGLLEKCNISAGLVVTKLVAILDALPNEKAIVLLEDLNKIINNSGDFIGIANGILEDLRKNKLGESFDSVKNLIDEFRNLIKAIVQEITGEDIKEEDIKEEDVEEEDIKEEDIKRKDIKRKDIKGKDIDSNKEKKFKKEEESFSVLGMLIRMLFAKIYVDRK